MWWKVTLEEEFKKNPELKAEDIQEIHTWMKSEPHLPSISDLNVVMLLHSCKWDLEQTKLSVEAYYTYRTLFTEFFSPRDPFATELREIANIVHMAILPQSDAEGNRIFWCSLADKDPNHYNFAGTVRYSNMITDVYQLENGTVPGIIIVYDVGNFTWSHIFKFPFSQMSKYSKYGQEAVAVRMKALHYVNFNSVLEKMMNLMKPLMNENVMSLMQIHTSTDSLFKVLPKEIAPKEYGGNAPSLKELNDANFPMLQKYKDYFVEEEQFRVDDSKRVSKKGK